jgi:tripartite-type tricarboxylate transporter receptor subunit TctC
VPTFVEKGLDIVYSAWHGIGSPKGIPKEVSQKLKEVIYKVMRAPQTINGIKSFGG